MSGVIDQIIQQEFLSLWKETFTQVEGHYLDRGTSLLETLEQLTAAQASAPHPKTGETVAAHVFHLSFYLRVLDEFATGRRTGKVDWAESWVVKTVDEAAWIGLLDRLRADYALVQEACRRWDWSEEDQFGGMMSMLVHTGFHLGALRQILDTVR